MQIIKKFNHRWILFLVLIQIATFQISAQEHKDSPSPPVTEEQEDSTSAAESQEESFENYIDTLYHGSAMDINKDGWDNKMINAGRFDSKNMLDTIRIKFSDPSNHLSFCPPFRNYVTSGFGARRFMFHYGTDIKLQIGDSVYAAFDGVIRVTKFDRKGFGNVVVIRHQQGLETIYGHLSKVLVETNQNVKAGDLIGLGGNSGRSTGSHLHFETRYQGEPFDPSCVYDFNAFKLKHDTLTLTRSNFEYLVELRKAKYCSVRKGDTIGRIAHKYHTSVKNVCKLNHLTSKSMLRVGRKIRVM